MSAAWGFEWGEVVWGDGAFVASDRLLMFTRSPRLAALVDTYGDRTQALLDEAALVGAAFDLDNATGVHLDRIGAILQLPRYGYGDTRYRTLLQVQAQLVLSSTTATPIILRIAELFSGHAPLTYADAYPLGYRISVVLDDPDDADLLLQILASATAAAYGIEVIVAAADSLIGDYSTAPLTLTTGDVGDYSTAPITGARPGAYSYRL